MTISRTKKLAGIAAAAGLLVALAGCGAAPEATPTGEPSADAGMAVEGFLPCLVSDDGGFNDKSFNQSALEGMQRAADELGVELIEVESGSANDYAPNLENLIAEGCTFIVAVGFKLSADTIASATANPEVNYAIIDDYADADFDGETDAPNIKPLVVRHGPGRLPRRLRRRGMVWRRWRQQASAPSAASRSRRSRSSWTASSTASRSTTRTRAKTVETFGWDVEAQDGSFTGGFAANDTAKQTAQGILDQGVDVILPVGGPIYQSAADAIADAGSDTVMLGVDSDLAVVDPSVADMVLVSIMKRIDTAVYDATMQAATGEFDVDAVRRHARERGRRPVGLRRRSRRSCPRACSTSSPRCRSRSSRVSSR